MQTTGQHFLWIWNHGGKVHILFNFLIQKQDISFRIVDGILRYIQLSSKTSVTILLSDNTSYTPTYSTINVKYFNSFIDNFFILNRICNLNDKKLLLLSYARHINTIPVSCCLMHWWKPIYLNIRGMAAFFLVEKEASWPQNSQWWQGHGQGLTLDIKSFYLSNWSWGYIAWAQYSLFIHHLRGLGNRFTSKNIGKSIVFKQWIK